MAADKIKDILKHFPDLEEGWKEMEEKLKTEPAEREMLSLKYREMLQRESSKESLVESEFTKAKRAESVETLKSQVMKAPDKIYLANTECRTLEGWHRKPFAINGVECIEYTRTDAFIKKAKEWLKLYILNHDNIDVYQIGEDFKNYMKG